MDACLWCSSCHWGEISPIHPLIVQALLVVAGGGVSGLTSSVLTLLPGAEDWTSLASLPRPLVYAQASILGGRLRMTGGRDGDSYRSEVMDHEIVG